MTKIFQDARASLRKENMSLSNPLRSLPALKAPLSPLTTRSPNVVSPSLCVKSRDSVQDLRQDRVEYPDLPKFSPLSRPSASPSPTRNPRAAPLAVTPPGPIPPTSPSRWLPPLSRPPALRPITNHTRKRSLPAHSPAPSSASWSDDAFFLPPPRPRPHSLTTSRISTWLASVPASPTDLAAASPEAYTWTAEAESVDWQTKRSREWGQQDVDVDAAAAEELRGLRSLSSGSDSSLDLGLERGVEMPARVEEAPRTPRTRFVSTLR